jgi:hypothetical protein
LAPHYQAEIFDYVLVVGQEVAGRAHGAIGIVSGNAVRDLDVVGHGFKLSVQGGCAILERTRRARSRRAGRVGAGPSGRGTPGQPRA